MSDAQVLSLTCVQCPMGCPLEVTLADGEVVSVTGNTYGEHEATHPERVVTSLVDVAGDYHPVSVKTAAPVPRELVADVLAAIRATVVRPPVAAGDVVVADVCGTGVDVVATKSHD